MSKSEVVLEVGMILTTLDGHRYTNAIITDIGEEISVLTDFGNEIKFSGEKTLLLYYKVSEGWLEHRALGYHLPSVVERINEQITNLINYLTKHTN